MMPRNRHYQEMDVKRSQQDNTEIAIEKVKTEDIKKLKTLDELIKEKP